MGVNYGVDGIVGTLDDRNEFTAKYYQDNQLKVYSNPEEKDEKFSHIFLKYMFSKPLMSLTGAVPAEGEENSLKISSPSLPAADGLMLPPSAPKNKIPVSSEEKTYTPPPAP